MVDTVQKKTPRNPRKPGTKRGMTPSEAASKPPKKSILAALRRSPLVGADLNLARPRHTARGS